MYLKTEELNRTNEQNYQHDYSTYLLNLKIDCQYMNINKNFDYELSTECLKCQKKLICEKYIYLQNMTNTCQQRSKVVNKTINKVETIKLNVKYVTLSKNIRSKVNKELKRRIEQMKYNDEEIKVLTL